MVLVNVIKDFSQQKFFKFILLIIVLCLSTLTRKYVHMYAATSNILLVFIIGTICLLKLRKERRSIGRRDVIVLTGCDSGLGYSFALHCKKNLGAYVVAGVHNIDSPGAKELAKAGIHVYSLELTSSESVRSFVDHIRSHLKNKKLALRCFVNNAGVMVFGEFEWQTEEQVRYQVEVNLLGTMRMTKEILPLLREYSSRLINVTSHCAFEPLPGVAAYSSTKSALAGWTTALRVELKKYGVHVINFIPGSFVLQSNILSQQRKHFDAMEAAMTEEAKSFYSSYFTSYAKYLCGLPCKAEDATQMLENNKLYKVFQGALLDLDPHAVYKCEPLRYTVYHFLFKITPTKVRDWLVEWFVRMPRWKKNFSN
ncbi:D-beta-hydroxybutyrate dehydrogenase, mitochondrial [Microplitis mediator]|uniref:D-beta-hydroxybutyrate dehydrogenase, mitochondrial n=1 Tax=Microplitis mediator TaxID=375433 RepID=UPI002554AF25|nr:D-beta-hydroxybutyrate dehydrogenase, mitochondrial [Microplitis mediator]